MLHSQSSSPVTVEFVFKVSIQTATTSLVNLEWDKGSHTSIKYERVVSKRPRPPLKKKLGFREKINLHFSLRLTKRNAMRISLYLLLDLSLKFFFPQNRNNITLIVFNCKDKTTISHGTWLGYPFSLLLNLLVIFILRPINPSFRSFHCKPVSVNNNSLIIKWFEPRSDIPWLKKIISVGQYSLDSKDGFRTGCRNVSHKQQSFSGLLSPKSWSFSIKE